MPRIFYFCPDFPQPSGGVKTLYRHVQRLLESGFDAAMVHQRRDFKLSWHGYDVPVLWLEDRPHFQNDDVWVIPEVMLDFVKQTVRFGGTRVLFALSWLPSYSRLGPGQRWQDFGITRALVKSPHVARFLEWSMDLSVTRIPEFVDPARYYHAPGQKELAVAYMTRKDASGEWLRPVLGRKGAPFTRFTWVPLRNLDDDGYANHMRRASVYLPTTLQEGMHVSVLEAMACGSLVVGYAGVGGRDYMVGAGEGQNCILVENGDLLALGQTLETVLPQLHADREHFASIVGNGLKTAQQFQDAEAERQALQTFFESL